MKKTNFLWMIAAFFVLAACNKYDDEIDQLTEDITSVDSEVQQLAQQLLALQNWQTQVNTDIQSLKTIVAALEKKDYVTSVEPTADGTGYVITFQNSGTVTIHHGKDGETPDISVKQAEDGLYYWTVDGDWLTDAAGMKIPTTGADGKDGADGEDGKDGADAIAPQVRISSTTNLWEISTDGGSTWTSTGVQATGPKGDKGNTGATGAQGPQGEKGDKGDKGDTGASGSDGDDGSHGDSFFRDVQVEDGFVKLILSNGTEISIPLKLSFGIQSLTFVPQYTDGKVEMDYTARSMQVHFRISPAEIAKLITADNVKAFARYTNDPTTRAFEPEFPLAVTSIAGDETGMLEVSIAESSEKRLSTDFWQGKVEAIIYIQITDDNGNNVVSEAIPMIAHNYAGNTNSIGSYGDGGSQTGKTGE